MITVYRIDTVPSSTNAYTTGRMETWTLHKDKTFDDSNEAIDYVRAMNRAHSELPRVLADLKDPDAKEAFIDTFCFSEDKYLHLRRYFLGMPDRNKIIASIKDQGANVVNA